MQSEYFFHRYVEGAIMKTMTAIEEMDGMDVLCSDKTGTLTLNKLTVDKNLIEVFAKGIDKDTVVLMAARASRTKNRDSIDAAIVGILADPKELDKAAALGTTLVLWLLVVIFIDSIKHGLPAIGNGQLEITGVPSLKNISQAISIFGFAFYIQPIMMPYLMELPSRKTGISILKWATRFVVLGISFIVYAIIGLFGAARYGDQTSDNILENKWLGGGIGQGFLNLSISLYLALSVPMVVFPIRHAICCWFPENKKSRLLQLCITVLILLLSLSLALSFPDNSGNVLVATGAVGVCIVSYLVPIINHFLLLFKRVKPLEKFHGQDANVHVQENDSFEASQSMNYKMKTKDGTWNLVIELIWEILIPILVIGIGLFCSIIALCTL